MHTIGAAVAVVAATATLRYCGRIKMKWVYCVVPGVYKLFAYICSSSIYWGNLLSNSLPFSSVKVIQAIPHHFRLIIERLWNTSWAFAAKPSYHSFDGSSSNGTPIVFKLRCWLLRLRPPFSNVLNLYVYTLRMYSDCQKIYYIAFACGAGCSRDTQITHHWLYMIDVCVCVFSTLAELKCSSVYRKREWHHRIDCHKIEREKPSNAICKYEWCCYCVVWFILGLLSQNFGPKKKHQKWD